MKYLSTASLLLLFLLSGCHSKPEEYILVFTIESVNNYKVSIDIEKDKSYQIRKQNIFLDMHARKEQIQTSNSVFSEDEYAELSELVAGSRLFKMKDAYGFEQEPNPDNPLDDLIYQLTYTEGRKTKYISIRTNSTDRFPDTFLKLLRFLSQYISTHSTN